MGSPCVVSILNHPLSCAVILCSTLIFSPFYGVQKLLNLTKIVDGGGHRLAVAPSFDFVLLLGLGFYMALGL